MTELFSSGICLITTSNIEPKNLYANGLQRKLFIPAIKSIEKNCEIFFLNSDSDYRLRTLEQTKLVFIPLGNESELNMLDTFMALSKSKKINDSSIKVLDRKINIIKSSEGTIWFNFKDICSSPRSSADYIEIAKEFHNVLISNIPIINSDDEARRFISLIDECYDRKVKIITSAAIEFPKIYTGNKLIEKYKRTVSRLIEMQSKEYLKEAHKP
jgi:cell division protein ZapE